MFCPRISSEEKGFVRARKSTHASIVWFFSVSFMGHMQNMVYPKMLSC